MSLSVPKCESCKTLPPSVSARRVETNTRWLLCRACFVRFVSEYPLDSIRFFPPGKPPRPNDTPPPTTTQP